MHPTRLVHLQAHILANLLTTQHKQRTIDIALSTVNLEAYDWVLWLLQEAVVANQEDKVQYTTYLR